MNHHEITDFDLHLLNEGRHFRSFEKLGAQVMERDGTQGVRFAVWAPHAREVSVIGDFNGWDPRATQLSPQWPLGTWTAFVPNLGTGARYKYSILPATGADRIDKSDPYAFYSEVPPQNASRVWNLQAYDWRDQDWMAARASRHRLDAPLAIYEVHLGSWMRMPEQGNRRLTYAEVAPLLADHVEAMGFTHVQLMPLMEHPDDESLGYLPTGVFAPTSRYGTPSDLMSLVNLLHLRGIGVILDWPVGRLPRDAHGLVLFDGESLYEAPQPAGVKPQSDAPARPNLKSRQVVNFLVSSALYWVELYHLDGLRITGLEDLLHPLPESADDKAVTAKEPQREDPDAVNFVRLLTDRLRAEWPSALLIAEDTTFRWDVTKPMVEGGLGFDLRLDSSWVRDFFHHYMKAEPEKRSQEHHWLMTSDRGGQAGNRVLPLSFRETGGARTSPLSQLPGDDWRRFANFRVLLGFLYTLPGKKSLFMGSELGSLHAWNPATNLDWHLRSNPRNNGLSRWVRDLNTQYRGLPALHAGDCRADGLAWVDLYDGKNCVICYLRKWGQDQVLVVCNFMPTPRHNYRVGVPIAGAWDEILNSDAPIYGGSGQGNLGGLETAPVPWHGHAQSLNLILPPLGMVAFRSLST